MLFVELVDGMLFGELVKVAGDWLWRNGRIGSMPEVGFGCSYSVVLKKVKDRMENIAGGDEPIAWCGLLLGVQFVVKALHYGGLNV
jgi:hypothetical protein